MLARETQAGLRSAAGQVAPAGAPPPVPPDAEQRWWLQASVGSEGGPGG